MDDANASPTIEVTRTSWLRRMGQALGGTLIGLLLVVGSIGMLFWNEGRAIRTAQGLAEGAGVVIDVGADRIDPANDGRLIHATGMLTSEAPVDDREFGVRVAAVRLQRQVEMYQWKEEASTESRTRFGGGEERTTAYKYVRAWSDKPVDSTRFKEPRGHANPSMPFQSQEAVAPGIRLGAFAVPASLSESFGDTRPLPASDAQAAGLQARLNLPVAAMDGVLHLGREPAQPAVGDIRISFLVVPLQSATIVAAQSGNGFAPYPTRSGTTVELIAAGAVPAADMFHAAQASNQAQTWVFRGVGVLVMFVGFALTLRPLGVAGDVIPMLGSIIRAGSGFVAAICTATIATIAIAAGWLWYRPFVGVAVLALGAVATVVLVGLARRRSKPNAAA